MGSIRLCNAHTLLLPVPSLPPSLLPSHPQALILKFREVADGGRPRGAQGRAQGRARGGAHARAAAQITAEVRAELKAELRRPKDDYASLWCASRSTTCRRLRPSPCRRPLPRSRSRRRWTRKKFRARARRRTRPPMWSFARDDNPIERKTPLGRQLSKKLSSTRAPILTTSRRRCRSRRASGTRRSSSAATPAAGGVGVRAAAAAH